MKKAFKIIVLLLVVSLLTYLGYSVITKMQFKNKIEKRLQSIPNFSFKTLENKNFTNQNLKLNTPTIFIYFNTECDYCQHEAQSFSENLEQFKNVQILFVSTENTENIKKFAESYKLLNQRNITFLSDNKNIFSAKFDANSIPFLLVYNKNKELIKKHKGQLKAETILKLLE